MGSMYGNTQSMRDPKDLCMGIHTEESSNIITVKVQLKIASWNCKHFSGSLNKAFARCVFDKCDCLLLQEHWLYESSLKMFAEIYANVVIMKEGKITMDCGVS